MLVRSFSHLVLALSDVADCREVVLPMINMLEENPEPALNEIQQFLISSSPVQILVPDYAAFVPRCCVSIHNSMVAQSHWDRVWKLGQAWVLFGCMQSSLLAPQGPVDPVHKLAVKMGYTKEEVSATVEHGCWNSFLWFAVV
jgi:hypothetical protein